MDIKHVVPQILHVQEIVLPMPLKLSFGSSSNEDFLNRKELVTPVTFITPTHFLDEHEEVLMLLQNFFIKNRCKNTGTFRLTKKRSKTKWKQPQK